MSIKRIVVADASEGNNGTLRTAGGGGSGAPPTMRFSVEDSNVESPRSAGGGASGAPRTMGEWEGGNEGDNEATPSRRDPVINSYAK